MKLSEEVRGRVWFWHTAKENSYVMVDTDKWSDRIAALEAELEAAKAENARKDQLIKQMNFALSHQVPKYSIS